jgi:hypothetical protein
MPLHLECFFVIRSFCPSISPFSLPMYVRHRDSLGASLEMSPQPDASQQFRRFPTIHNGSQQFATLHDTF